jgi:predicted glycosyltransferase
MMLPRLDILIYAHDGRGLGHASRSVAIGMALRRRFPEKRVLFISGCKQTASLIGPAPLDWIKLPSYETKVIEGRSKGTPGNSNFGLKELGRYRAETIRQIVTDYRPRVVLVDHQPQGKQKELLPAIEETKGSDTRWVLGIRGIVGDVPQVHSELGQTIFRSRFKALFWYGDPNVLGTAPLESLASHFNTRPLALGYVSRMGEMLHWQPPSAGPGDQLAGTISIPWLEEDTPAAIAQIAEALRRLGERHGRWRLFIGCKSHQEQLHVQDHFKELPFCQVENPSDRYPEALAHSRFALIYGGYNSIIDVLQAGIPAMVLIRGMQDGEQQQHLEKLNTASDISLEVVRENALTAEAFASAVVRRWAPDATRHINLAGAEAAAGRLVELIENQID